MTLRPSDFMALKPLSLFLFFSLFLYLSCSHEESIQRNNKTLDSSVIITQKTGIGFIWAASTILTWIPITVFTFTPAAPVTA